MIQNETTQYDNKTECLSRSFGYVHVQTCFRFADIVLHREKDIQLKQCLFYLKHIIICPSWLAIHVTCMFNFSLIINKHVLTIFCFNCFPKIITSLIHQNNFTVTKKHSHQVMIDSCTFSFA